MTHTLKGFVCTTLTTLLALVTATGLTACGPKEPQTAQELASMSAALEDADNFHMAMDYDISLAMDDYKLPFTMTMDMDLAGNNAHGAMTTEIFGNQTVVEEYVAREDETWATYMSTDGKTWSRQEMSSSVSTISQLDSSQFENAEFEKTEDGYVVRLQGSELADEVAQMDSLSSLTEILGDDSQQMIENALNNAQITYTFGTDYRLVGMDMTLSMVFDGEQLMGMQVRADCTVHATLSDYGSVDTASVSVPDEVKNKATADTGLDDILETETGDLLGEEEGEDKAA